MRKYFCDKCGKELDEEELNFSLEMTGKELCSKHAHEITDKKVVYKAKRNILSANGRHYEKDSSGNMYPID